MMRSIPFALLFVSSVFAQPPNVIRVVRQGAIQPYIDGQAQVNVLGMSAISGPSENWLIEMHDSFASFENMDKALTAATSGPMQNGAPFPDVVLGQSGALIALYRPGLSYRPDQGMQVFPKMRYLDVVLSRIRPGTEADLAKLLKLRNFGLDSINLDRPEIVYQVISGAPAGTYIFLSPIISLRTLDDGRPFTPVYAEGAEESAKKIAAATELVREHLWFRIEPRLSYVSDEFASPDSGFWRPAK